MIQQAFSDPLVVSVTAKYRNTARNKAVFSQEDCNLVATNEQTCQTFSMWKPDSSKLLGKRAKRLHLKKYIFINFHVLFGA